MELLSSEIESYIAAHTTAEPPYLAELNRETHLKVLYPRMLSGQVQGRFLSMISHLQRPERILEIGTFTGYATICLAEGLAPGGHITAIEKNPELEVYIRKGLRAAGIEDQVSLHFGAAFDLLPDLKGPFDLIFIDADKKNYLDYYELSFDRLKPGGLILADNVLWSGSVIDPDLKSREIEGIRAFNERVAADERIEHVLLPLRDGIMMVRRKI